MVFFPCNFCGVQRPVHTRSWMRSQVDNIIQNGSPVVGFYNSCRQCSPCCWIDPPLPEGASPPNLCIVCREIREVHRQHWMPSQIRSIWSLHTSVTDEYNCCRSCDPACWVPILGRSAPPSQNPRPAKPMPPSSIVPPPPPQTVPSASNSDHQQREPTPPPPPLTPPPASDHSEPHQSHWRPLPFPTRPLPPSALAGLTRWRLQMTFSTFGKPSQQDFGTSLSTTWKRQCANDCRGGAPVSFQIPLWALRQLLLAMAAATYVVNGSITTTPPISSKTQVHPSSWMSATAYTNNFCCRCGPVHRYGIPIRIKSISATSSRRFLVLSSSTGPTLFRPAPSTLASPTTALWSYSKLYQEFALQHFATRECSAVTHFVEFNGS